MAGIKNPGRCTAGVTGAIKRLLHRMGSYDTA
jgi:hypothetical protein